MTSMPISLGASGPLSHQWLAVARPEDVAHAPAAVRLLGRDLVLWRSPNGTVVAAPDKCTHSKADLSKGEVNNGLLACPKHGWTFADQGRCVFKPSGLPINDKAHLKTHHCTERYGAIWVALDQPTTPIIDITKDSDTSYRRIHSSMVHWQSNAIQAVGSLLAQTDSSFDDVNIDVPFVVQGTSKLADGTDHHQLLTATPVDSRSSLVTSVVWINGGSSDDEQQILAATRAYLNRARSAAESQAIPLPTVEITADEQHHTAEWKQRLLALFGPPAA